MKTLTQVIKDNPQHAKLIRAAEEVCRLFEN